MEQEPFYHFGPFCLNTKERVLLRDGRLVPLAPKALSTLLVLVRNKGHVVEKDVLMSEVWPDEFVEEGNLTQHVFMVRRALGDTTDTPGYIETIPRRGYRFLELPPNDTASKTRRPDPAKLKGGLDASLAGRYSVSSDAHQHYLKGRFHWNKRSAAALGKSIACFNQAISLDPDYALAHAGLADSYNMMGFYGMLAPADAFPKARNAAVKALEIDRTLAEAHAALGFATLLHEWDWDRAERLYRQSIELNPNYITAYLVYGCHLVSAGRFEEAIESYQNALKIDPLSLIANAALGYGYYFARHYDQAIEQCKVAIELDEHFEVAHVWLGWAYEQKGMRDEAILEYHKAIRLSGGRTGVVAALGRAYALIGKKKRAGKVLEDLTKLANPYVSPYRIACIYAALGQTDEAFEYLEKAYKDRSHLLVNLQVDPKLDCLRSDPRLADLIERVFSSSRHAERDGASQSFLEGRLHWSRHTREGLVNAIGHFRRAIELDPGYVLAYAALVDCYLRLTTNYFLPQFEREQDFTTAKTSDDLSPATRAALRLHEAWAVAIMEKEKTRAALRLREAWDMEIMEREKTLAAELNSTFPGANQWLAAYRFARKLYEEKHGSFDQVEIVPVPTSGEQQPDAVVLTSAEEIQVFCLITRCQALAGNIEAGRLMLQRWVDVGQWPRLEGLSANSSADLLLTAGLLVGRLGTSMQLRRGQIHAEALINGALGMFEQLGFKNRAAECKSELGRCYDREGKFDLARMNFLQALDDLPPDDLEAKAKALRRLAFAEMKMGHLHESLGRLNEASAIVASAGPVATMFFHVEMATTLGELAIAENSNEYFKLACQHYQKALFESEAVGHHRCSAVIETNHGYLLLAFENLQEAELHLLRARELFDHFSDRSPQTDETLARLYLQTEQFELAEQAIIRSVAALEQGGEEAHLAESLRTQGLILCKLNRRREAQKVFDRAYQIANLCGDQEGAGLALLLMMEELPDHFQNDEQLVTLGLIEKLLAQSQRSSIIERLTNVDKALERSKRNKTARAKRSS